MLQTETVESHTFSLLKRIMDIHELKGFSLVGGTALSLLFGHRKSIDLNFFSINAFENLQITEPLKNTFREKFIMEERSPFQFLFVYCKKSFLLPD